MDFFTSKEIAPGIFHIGEPAGVYCTLIVGTKRALLFDTGYGFRNVGEFVSTLTNLPLTVINSHGHLDHAGGSHYFDQVFAHPYEQEVYKLYQDEKRSLLDRLETRYQTGKIPRPWPEGFDLDAYCTVDPCKFLPLANHRRFDLGGRTAEAVYLPGHTKGCIVLYDQASGILLSGDNIADSLWIMFEQSASLQEYEKTLEQIKSEYAISGILASHRGSLYPPSLIDETLRCIDTRQGNSTPFIHPRKGFDALKHKMYAKGIGYIYLVYPKNS